MSIIDEIADERDRLREENTKLKAQLEQAQSACAEMRQLIENMAPCFNEDPDAGEDIANALSTTCGRGYVRFRDVKEYLKHAPLCEHNDAESPMCTCGLDRLKVLVEKANL